MSFVFTPRVRSACQNSIAVLLELLHTEKRGDGLIDDGIAGLSPVARRRKTGKNQKLAHGAQLCAM